jgi:hypothetical protein
MKFLEFFNNILNEEKDVGIYISKGGIWMVEIFNRGEREIPHIHVITPKNKISAPMLNKAEYFIHENKTYIMNSKEKSDFYEFMKRIENGQTLNNWQLCVKRWNLTKPENKKISSELKDMPNYLLLP